MRTMKIMKRMMGLAAAILALSACSESEDLLSAFHSDPNAVRITAEVGKASANGFTRSYPLGDADAQKKFKEGDMISVKADGQDAVTYQLNGTEWQPKESSKFLKWESDEMTFTAYYPATFDGNLNNITLPKEYDETSLAANDFMSYSGKQSNKNGNQLSLTMRRKMARVVVEIDGFNDQYAGAKIDNVNSLSICGIKAYKHGNKFYALIKPCAAKNSETFISLDVAEGESKTTTETLTGIPELTAGNSYTYKLTVGKNNISVSGITVKDWTGGTITDNGKTEECPTPYVTFKAEAEQKFMMTTEGGYTFSNLEYSVNNSEWASVAIGTEIPFGGDKGDLRLRGINTKGTAIYQDSYSTITFDSNVKVACTGDIRTLLDWRNYNIVDTQNARFCTLFKNCSVLTSAPELPATTLANYCYYAMFNGCTNLTSAPELPATTLANSCYYEMFRGCINLESAPVLPATTLVNNCYKAMFWGCTSLESAPVLPATKLELLCYGDMFYGCTSLTAAPKLPATKLAPFCYYEMFYNCTSLESAPVLPATELAEACYCKMFSGCANLSSVTMLAPSDKIKDTSDSFSYWLYGAGTNDGITRTLIVKDAAAYTALENTGYLPAIWKKDATNTTVEYYTPKP